MARIKPRNSIKSRNEADAAMDRINTIDRQFAEWDLLEAYEIALVRVRFAELRAEGNIMGLETEKSHLITELKLWAEVDSSNWEKKTIETPFGNLGFRISQPAVVLVKRVAKSFKAAIELLEAKLPQYVRKAPEVDKEAILAADREGTLDRNKLAGCGLTIKEQDDEFWVESAASKELEEAAKKLKAA